jgi:dipeptidyl aminopeptidase/acylaminoacyl peptidase
MASWSPQPAATTLLRQPEEVLGVYLECSSKERRVTSGSLTRAMGRRNLTNGRGSNWAPAWSPDGQQLAFYSDRAGTAQLWIWQRSSGQLREASAAIVRPHWTFEVPRWSPDGTLIALKALPEDLTPHRRPLVVEREAATATPCPRPGC